MTTDLIVMHIASWEREDVLERMRKVVDGELDLVANIYQVTDWQSVIKASDPCSLVPSTWLNVDQDYKIDTDSVYKDFTGGTPEERAIIDNIVISSVAMKSIMA